MNYSKLYINLENIKSNILKIKEKQNNKCCVIAMLKANAYGLGMIEVSKYLEENKLVSYLGVAYINEAVKMRENGIKFPIIVLNASLASEIEDILKYNDIIPGVSSYEYAKILNEMCKENNKTIKIHIEVNTGMNRFGLSYNNSLDEIIKISKLENIDINGIYMHFSDADLSEEYTEFQNRLFNKLLEKLKQNNIIIPYVHSSNSAASINLKNNNSNLIRPGIMIYGYYPDKSLESKIKLKPSCKLVSTITNIFEVKEGTPIGYNRKYITKRNTKIATVNIGYADGLNRQLSNRGYLLINGKKCNIIGNICMDSCMVDITDVENVKVSDEAIIFDNLNITLDEIAKECNTINYDILTSIGSRVERIYKKALSQ